MTRWIAVAVAAVLLLAAAGYGVFGTELFRKDKPAATPPAETPPPVVAKPLARSLFPVTDQQEAFSLDDGTRSVELLLPEPDRMVQTYNGVVYITWFFTSDGIYRADPRGKGQPLLLRYLPYELEDGLAWKQPVAGGYAWFRLNRLTACPVPEALQAECWQLQLLNRGELTTFTFASGMGAVGAVAENFATPRESFRKRLTAFGAAPAGIDRAAVLATGLKLDTAAKAPLEPVFAADFDAAVAAARQ